MKIKKAIVPIELTQEEANFLAELMRERTGWDTDTIEYDILQKLMED